LKRGEGVPPPIKSEEEKGNAKSALRYPGELPSRDTNTAGGDPRLRISPKAQNGLTNCNPTDSKESRTRHRGVAPNSTDADKKRRLLKKGRPRVWWPLHLHPERTRGSRNWREWAKEKKGRNLQDHGREPKNDPLNPSLRYNNKKTDEPEEKHHLTKGPALILPTPKKAKALGDAVGAANTTAPKTSNPPTKPTRNANNYFLDTQLLRLERGPIRKKGGLQGRAVQRISKGERERDLCLNSTGA